MKSSLDVFVKKLYQTWDRVYCGISILSYTFNYIYQKIKGEELKSIFEKTTMEQPVGRSIVSLIK